MVAERERVDRLVLGPAHPKVSLSRPTATRGNEKLDIKRSFNALRNGLSKPTGNVGQHAKNNLRDLECQYIQI